MARAHLSISSLYLAYYNQAFDFNVTQEGEWKLQVMLLLEGQPRG